MLLLTLLSFVCWRGVVVHTSAFYFNINLTGRCAPVAYVC